MCGSCELGIAFEVIDGFPYDKGYHDGVKRGIEISTPKWIPVTEELPEIGEIVLIYYRWMNPPDKYSFACDYLCINKATMKPVWNKHPHKERILYWMPLPEPPKENKL